MPPGPPVGQRQHQPGATYRPASPSFLQDVQPGLGPGRGHIAGGHVPAGPSRLSYGWPSQAAWVSHPLVVRTSQLVRLKV